MPRPQNGKTLRTLSKALPLHGSVQTTSSPATRKTSRAARFLPFLRQTCCSTLPNTKAAEHNTLLSDLFLPPAEQIPCLSPEKEAQPTTTPICHRVHLFPSSCAAFSLSHFRPFSRQNDRSCQIFKKQRGFSPTEFRKKAKKT